MCEQLTNIKLVQEVEKYPCLYDYKLPEYSREDITEKAWTEVGKAVNLTESLAKEKWRNVRTVFTRYLKPAPSGSTKTTKTYYLAEVMQFAIPFITAKGSTASSGNLANFSTQSQIQASPGNAVSADESEKQIIPEVEDFLLQPEFPTTETFEIESTQQQTPLPSPKATPPMRKRKTRSTLSEVDNSFMEFFKAKKENLKKASTEKKPMEMFLLSLLPEIEAMNEHQKILFKRRMLVLIDDIVRPGVIPVPPPSYTVTTQNATNMYADSTKNSAYTEKTDYYDFPEETIIDDVAAYQVYEESDDCQFIPE